MTRFRAAVSPEPDRPETGQAPPERVGARLNALRTEQGLTLERLATLAGLTRGYLSLLERDLKTPSLAALVRISDALKIEVSTLFCEKQAPPAGYVLYRHAEPSDDADPRGANTVPLAPTRSGKVMEPFFISPSFKPVKRATHSGDELIVVLSGTVLVRLGTDQLTLQANDSLYFTASMEHQLQSLGSARAKVLAVVSRIAREDGPAMTGPDTPPSQRGRKDRATS